MDNRHIRFCDRSDQVDLPQLLELFKIGAFWAKERSLEGLTAAIANSDPVVTVWDGNKLVGHARATSDTVYRATIWDVVIHPDFRGTGLGRKLVQTVLAHPRVSSVERVYLMTTHQQAFYEHIGFELNQSVTLVLQNQGSSPAELLLSQSITNSTQG